MAVQRRSRVPLLGILDDPIPPNDDLNTLTSCTSKIGGFPHWLTRTVPYPQCHRCGHELALVVHIYAPLGGSPYHRTLTVFGCINRRCWNKSDSWCVLRSQKLTEPNEKIDLNSLNSNANIGEWGNNSDDWGDDDEEDEEPSYDDDEDLSRDEDMEANLNQRTQKPSFPANLNNQRSGYPLTGSPTGSLDDQGNSTAIVDSSPVIENFQRLNVQEERHDHMDPSITASSSQQDLQLNNIGGSPIMEGAVGIDYALLGASAEVESPDDPAITIDTPPKPEAGLLVAIGGEGSSGSSPETQLRERPVLSSWYLAVIEEPVCSDNSTYNGMEHERELLVGYQRREGLNINDLCNASTSLCVTGGETYEKILPKHGDRAFFKLQSRLALFPSQLLRYCRDGGSPLLLSSSVNPEQLHPGHCNYCGRERVFEMQLMPTLVRYLRMDDTEEPVLEFGTVIVYTCGASCWQDGDSCREERVLVLPDPDEDMFSHIRSRATQLVNLSNQLYNVSTN